MLEAIGNYGRSRLATLAKKVTSEDAPMPITLQGACLRCSSFV